MSTALAVVESWLTGFGFVLNIPRMNTPHTVSMFIAVLLVGCGQGEQKTIHQVPAVPVTGSPPTTASPEDDLIGGLFELGTSLVKTADELGQAVFGLTPSEQKEIGERLHTQLKAKHGLHRDRKQLTRIERLAAPLQKQMKRDDVTLSFHLLDLDEVNAFSHVGPRHRKRFFDRSSGIGVVTIANDNCFKSIQSSVPCCSEAGGFKDSSRW